MREELIAYEPPLHRAVLCDDYSDVKKLGAQDVHFFHKNNLGFTALELARLLGKKVSVNILQPKPPKLIQVLRRGTSKSKLLTEEEFKNFFFVNLQKYYFWQ